MRNMNVITHPLPLLPKARPWRKRGIIVVICLLSLLFVFASVTGTGGTAANSGGGTAWLDPTNAQACDNVYTSLPFAGGTGRYLLVTNYGFTIPTDATINGVVVDVHCKGTQTASGVWDTEIQLVKSGTAGGDNKATSTVISETEEVRSYGGASDTWAAGFTYTDWNTSTSGVRIKFYDGAEGADIGYVDCVPITVYYTEAGTGVRRRAIGYGGGLVRDEVL